MSNELIEQVALALMNFEREQHGLLPMEWCSYTSTERTTYGKKARAAIAVLDRPAPVEREVTQADRDAMTETSRAFWRAMVEGLGPVIAADRGAEVIARHRLAHSAPKDAGVEAALATIPNGWSWSLGQMMGLPLDQRYRCFLTDHSRDPDGKGTHHLDRNRASPVEAIHAAVEYGKRVWDDSPALSAAPSPPVPSKETSDAP